jgi:hypothetical protein
MGNGGRWQLTELQVMRRMKRGCFSACASAARAVVKFFFGCERLKHLHLTTSFQYYNDKKKLVA